MKFLKGKAMASRILGDIKNEIRQQRLKPTLAVFYVGNDKASQLYIGLKEKAARNAGIRFKLFRFSVSAKEAEIICAIEKVNNDNAIHGIIVQLPLPKKFNTQHIINAIKPEKDVDGFSAKGGSAFGGHPKLMPVFPYAILLLVQSSRQKIYKKSAIVLSNSHKFGSTMKEILKRQGAIADYILAGEIKNNLAKIKNADIVITVVGKPGIITGEIIKKGAIIIDGGISKKGKKVLGDVDAKSVEKIAGFLSPVPGGVGPVTIACLLKNVYLAAISK